MKVPALKKQIIRNFSVVGVFAIAFSAIFYYYSNEKSNVEKKIEAINSETSEINVELSDLQSKTAEIKKYKDMWLTITPNRKDTSGIKLDEINGKMSKIADKYAIKDQTIKLSLPEVMKGGIFDRKTISIMMTTASVNFSAASDIKALMFVNEFISSLKGYPVITSFSISKTKDYDNNDLVQLSSGKLSGVVNGKIDFYWYIYKELEKKEEQKTDKPSDPADNTAGNKTSETGGVDAPNS